ncbi:hypothetical protein IJG14_00075 [bacterium]|nr:hypothetical protein [bacterium]
MNILKSFELFWSIPKKLFSKKVFRIFHVETSEKQNTEQSVQLESIGNKEIILGVYNSPKVYSLLTSVLYKKKMLNENQNSKIYQECSNS